MTRVAYLVSDYAAPSHTFVRREVEAVRSLGVTVAIFSVQANADADADARVESLLGRSINAYSLAVFGALFSAPRHFFLTWALALRHRPPGIRALLWSQFHFIEALMLSRLIGQKRVEHLHVHFANSGATVGLLAAHYAKVPFSLTLHGISETDYPAGLLLRDKIERASFVACASSFMRAQGLRQVSPEHWIKFFIVRCGIDRDALPDADRLSDHANLQLRLVCVGRLSPEKGYVGLFSALQRLVADGIDWSLTVVGDGPSSEQLRQSVDELGLEDRVEFVGYLDEVATLKTIAQSDILVLASLMEGLPAVLIEAMALGRPVIAPRIAGIPELVEDGINGLMFTPSDWGDLERALRTMIAKRDRWTDWGIAGKSAVEREFLIEASADKMAALFRGEAPQ